MHRSCFVQTDLTPLRVQYNQRVDCWVEFSSLADLLNSTQFQKTDGRRAQRAGLKSLAKRMYNVDLSDYNWKRKWWLAPFRETELSYALVDAQSSLDVLLGLIILYFDWTVSGTLFQDRLFK